MEWNRGSRPTPTAGAPVNHVTGAQSAPAAKKNKAGLNGIKLASIVLLFAGTALIVAVILGVNRLGGSSVADAVDKNKMQAVFLNGGQVYFGKISDINDRNVQLKDIYYLRVNQQVQPNQTDQTAANNDISLVKLGCELHGPQDSMVINQEQVIFWENLRTDGQVAKAVEEYKKQNPDGQKCEETANQNTNSSQTEQSAPTTPTPTTPAPTTTTPANNTRR